MASKLVVIRRIYNEVVDLFSYYSIQTQDPNQYDQKTKFLY